ncbi:MAG: methionine biosynthesis protein MetW [Candidatus Omnitrophota bacterium]
MDKIRLDHRIIYKIIKPGSKVLDLGCGNGDLLYFLVREKKVKAQGIELDEQAIYKCVEKGLSVFHGDIESGLSGFPDQCFDYVILNQSMQEVKKVDYVMNEALRIGNKVIVGFSNFVYISARLRIFLGGKVPITVSLPYRWHNTPNVHFLSISDFRDFCKEKNLAIIKSFYLGRKKVIRLFPNLLALNAIFLISSGKQ